MKVLLVAGGDIPIPPPAWGGVENLIWQQKTALEQAGHAVTILNNKKSKRLGAIKAKPWAYDIVHLHSDGRAKIWVPLARMLRFNLVVSTHYGYAAFPDKWRRSYFRTFRHMSRAKSLILISPEIRDVFRQRGCRAEMFVLPNGIDCDNTRFAPQATRQAIFLGKIEARKKQTLLAERLNDHTVGCDFAGPIDPEEVGFAVNDRNTHYLGEWSRDQVRNELTEYAVLVLLSDGEGHAAVVSEAMAAGLSLVLSREASHNLDLSKPWIFVVDRENDNLGDVIQQAVTENPGHREAIREYCRAQFDWKVILPEYIAILEQIAHRGK